MKKCLYCYQKLPSKSVDFHDACAKKIFGTPHPPFLDFNRDNLDEIAKKMVNRKTAVPGVQSKLSLQLQKQRNESLRLTIVGLHGEYILKPPSKEYPELPENEDVTMHLAELAKINVSEHTLIRLESGEL